MSALRHEMTLLITTESLAYGTFVVDNTHRIVSWNDAATRIVGYDADATLGRTCEEMLHLLDAQQVPVCPDVFDLADTPDIADATDALDTPSPTAIDLHALRQQDHEPVQLRVITRHGAPRWLRFSIMRARTLDGASCVVHMFRDVTDETAHHGHGETMPHSTHTPGSVGSVLHLPVRTHGDGNPAVLNLSPEHLTRREREVLELLAQGMATIEIATALGISRVTARNHVTRVIEKLGVKTRLQAVLAASRLGLI